MHGPERKRVAMKWIRRIVIIIICAVVLVVLVVVHVAVDEAKMEMGKNRRKHI